MSNKLKHYGSENVQTEEWPEDSFWVKYYPKLQRYCHFLAQNKWDGDDIAQDAYIKALKYSSNKQKMTSSLLNKIAYNHWIDILRKRKNETIKADSELANQAVIDQPDDITNSVDLLLKQFTPKQAVIFLLKEAFQYQTKEIADILDTTEMAVKSSFHRAKKRLEKQDDQTFSVESFWDKEVREQLSDLFYESLKSGDPTILIQAIPSLLRVADVSKNSRPIQTQSPSSTLCMAA